MARELGEELARRGLALCNGGYGGTMEAAAEGARLQGGHTIGVTLSSRRRAKANESILEADPQPDLLSRIRRLIERGDGYVVLAGGTGTLAELGPLLELIGKRHVEGKPIVLLGSFWGPLLELLAKEKVLCRRSEFTPVAGVTMMGEVARTESPEAVARYLALNLMGREDRGRPAVHGPAPGCNQ